MSHVNHARLTILSNETWMGKRFFTAPDGLLAKQANGVFVNGTATVHTVEDTAALFRLLATLTPNDALCLGVPKLLATAASGSLAVTTRSYLPTKTTSGIQYITRTKDDFDFSGGEGWLLIDHDTKDLPPHIQLRIDDLGGIFNALTTIWPELKDADFIIKPSSSAGVRHVNDAPKVDKRMSFHMFVRLKRAADIPLALQNLQRRCWAAGLAYWQVSKSGQLLERSIIDVTVGSPERLIFTSEPILEDGIVRDVAHVIHQAGIALAAPTLPLVGDWSRKRDIARYELKGPAAEQQASYVDLSIKRCMQDFAISEVAARDIVSARIMHKVLRDEDQLELANGHIMSVGSLLDSLHRGAKIPCADPIEGRAYNPTAAAVIWDATHKTPALVSHAHGLVTLYQFARFEPSFKFKGAKA